jgi:hypothetical protein
VKKPETVFKEKVIDRLKEIPRLWFIKTQEVGRHGTPDLLLCYRGRFFAWELKVDDECQALQQYNLNRISEAGGVAREVTPGNFEQCLNELKGGLNEKRERSGAW